MWSIITISQQRIDNVAQILYVVWSHDTGSIANVQDQWVKSQCHSVTYRGQKIAKLAITQLGIFWLRSCLLQTMTTWHTMCHKFPKSRGQRSRSQPDITYLLQKNAIYKSGTDSFTKFKLGENYLGAERNTWQLFKVIRSNTETAITLRRIAQLR